jgi:hypothetical protein
MADFQNLIAAVNSAPRNPRAEHPTAAKNRQWREGNSKRLPHAPHTRESKQKWWNSLTPAQQAAIKARQAREEGCEVSPEQQAENRLNHEKFLLWKIHDRENPQ